MYIQGRYVNGIEDRSEVEAIRRQVFGEVERPLEAFYDLDTSLFSDEMAVHALVLSEGRAVGCGTLYYDGSVFLLDGIAVVPGERRKGYGDFIVRLLLDRAFQGNAKEILAYCDDEIFPLFKQIGFVKQTQGRKLCKIVMERGCLCKLCDER